MEYRNSGHNTSSNNSPHAGKARSSAELAERYAGRTEKWSCIMEANAGIQGCDGRGLTVSRTSPAERWDLCAGTCTPHRPNSVMKSVATETYGSSTAMQEIDLGECGTVLRSSQRARGNKVLKPGWLQ